MKIVLAFLFFNFQQVPGPAEIAIWAAEDCEESVEQGREVSGYRYIWIHRRDEVDCIDDARIIDLAPISMAISKSANVLKSHRVNPRLLRIDLNRLGVTEEKSKRLIDTWEKLRDLDHYVTAADSELLIDFVEVTAISPIKVEDELIRQSEIGEQLELGIPSKDPAWVSVMIDGEQAFISAIAVQPPKSSKERKIGPQCGQAGQLLSELVDSDIPIVRHDFLIRSIMHGDVVLRPIGQEGGLYYDFLQIDKATEDADKTDLQVWLEAFGANFEESQRLSADVGAILARSNVTGRSRAVTAFRGRTGKPGQSTGIVFGTFDSKDGDDFNANLDPIENILGFEHQASEWIATLPNGTQAYGLFNGNVDGQNQERQDFAPDDVAVDRTIPSPHSTRLVVGMCFRCHNTNEEDDGYKSVPNDLATILSRGRDIVTDQESADTIAARYSGDFDQVLQRTRDDHAATVFRITRDSKNQLEGLEPFEAFNRLSKIYHRYWYDLVDTEKALLDLGVVLEEGEDSKKVFSELLNVVDIGEAAPIVYLATGIPINRWQWESVYPEAVIRSQENKLPKEEIE